MHPVLNPDFTKALCLVISIYITSEKQGEVKVFLLLEWKQ